MAKKVANNFLEVDTKMTEYWSKNTATPTETFSAIYESAVVKNDRKDFLINNIELKELKPVKIKKAKKHKSKSRKTTKSKVGIFRKTILNIVSFFASYKRQFVTSALVVFAIAIVSLTSYAAYSSITLSNSDILAKVGSHVVLPVGVTPKVYIVQSEKSEFLNNPLFSDVKVGDNILNYESIGKVIVYRSKEDKIVNIVNTK